MGNEDETSVVGHLEAALETAEDEETRYHIRQALQYLAGTRRADEE